MLRHKIGTEDSRRPDCSDIPLVPVDSVALGRKQESKGVYQESKGEIFEAATELDNIFTKILPLSVH